MIKWWNATHCFSSRHSCVKKSETTQVQSLCTQHVMQVCRLDSQYLWSELQVEVGHKHRHSSGHIHACQLLTQAVAHAPAKGVVAPRLHATMRA